MGVRAYIYTVQGHFSPDVDGLEELERHADIAGAQQAVGLVQTQVAQEARGHLHDACDVVDGDECMQFAAAAACTYFPPKWISYPDPRQTVSMARLGYII